MSDIQGFVERIDAKQTSFGEMYDVVIDGVKYGAGKFKPKGVGPGDYIKFVADQKGRYWNIKAGTLSKLDKPAGVAPPAPKTAYAGGFSEDRQKTISKQAALNTAIAHVKLLVDAGALPGPAKASADKKADLIENIVLEFAAKFYHLSTGETFEVAEQQAVDLASIEEAGTWTE